MTPKQYFAALMQWIRVNRYRQDFDYKVQKKTGFITLKLQDQNWCFAWIDTRKGNLWLTFKTNNCYQTLKILKKGGITDIVELKYKGHPGRKRFIIQTNSPDFPFMYEILMALIDEGEFHV